MSKCSACGEKVETLVKDKCKRCYSKEYYRRNRKNLKTKKQILDLFYENPQKVLTTAEIKAIPDCSSTLIHQTLNKLMDKGRIISPAHGKYKLAEEGAKNCVFYPGYREAILDDGERIVGCVEGEDRKLCVGCSGPKVETGNDPKD